MRLHFKFGFAIITGIVLICSGVVFCQDKENDNGKTTMTEWTKIINSKVSEQIGDKGLVNFEEGYIEAVGTGAPPEQYYGKPQARPLALRAAQADAYRNLLETVQGVQIDSATTVKDFAVELSLIHI